MLGEKWMTKKILEGNSAFPRTHFVNLENWKQRRQDKKMELYWERVEKEQGYLTPYQEYQKEWNFRESDYNHEPSNNGLDPANPAFAFDKKLTKFLRHMSCVIHPLNGRLLDIRYED